MAEPMSLMEDKWTDFHLHSCCRGSVTRGIPDSRFPIRIVVKYIGDVGFEIRLLNGVLHVLFNSGEVWLPLDV